MIKAIIILLLMFNSGLVEAFDPVVIVNGNNQAYHQMIGQIRPIFLMQQRTIQPSNSILTVYVLPKESIVTQVFTQKYLGMTADRYYDIVFTKRLGDVPIIIGTDIDLIIKVASNPNSIGFINDAILSNINENLIREVK